MKILLFDVDNTLYPKRTNLFQLVDNKINQYLHQVANIPKNEVNYIRKKYLLKYGTTLNGLMKHHNIDPLHYLDYVHNVPVEKYIMENKALQNFLKTNPYKKVIFSNAYKPYILKILKSLNISDYFEYIMDITESGFQPKPLEAPYIELIKKFQLNPEKFIMIDDSVENLKTAKKLSFKTVLVGKPDFWENLNADYIIDKVEEIEKVVDF